MSKGLGTTNVGPWLIAALGVGFKSKVACVGDGSLPGEVFDLSGRDRLVGVSMAGVTRPSDGIGNSLNWGVAIGCGEVALRCLVRSFSISSASILSSIVFNLCSVAWRLDNNDPEGSCFGGGWPRTSLNMMLYRSNLVSGIFTSRNDAIGGGFPCGCRYAFPWRPGSPALFGWVGGSSTLYGVVFDRIMIGLCFGTFRSACVLLLAGVGFAAKFADDVDTSTVRASVIVDFPASVCARPCASSLFFPPPNSPNSFRFPVFFLCKDPTRAVPAGEGSEELVAWGDAGGN